MLISFVLYFAAGFAVVGVEAPKMSGLVIYMICILVLSAIMFCLAYAISGLLKKFGATYFGFMVLGGMMGITYDNMPEGLQIAAQMLPITYINRDFHTVWKGESYNYVPMLQSYLLLAAVTGILLFILLKKTARIKHFQR